MAELSYRDAVALGIAQEMRRDPNLVMLGEDIAAAQRQAYAIADSIDWAGAYYRRDIGFKALRSGRD